VQTESLRDIAASLAGVPVGEIEPVARGGNNRVFRVTAADGTTYALKLYPRLDDDPRDRLGHEFEGLAFLVAAGIGFIPSPVRRDQAKGAALYTWLEGEPVSSYGPTDIESMAGFMRTLHGLRGAPGATALAPAVEAVFSDADLLAQIERRLERLDAVADGAPGLVPFLVALRGEFERRRIDPGPPFPAGERTLSPSDLGFHNAVRLRDGRLGFVDFEYFGWDDPVKLTCDVLWHPGHALRAPESLQFRRLATEIYRADGAFEARLIRHFPLYGLRWALIVLNEFLPLAWKRRQLAGRTGDRREIEERQLAKAWDLLASVRAA